MTADSPMTDRRVTLKERRRRAILDAATELIAERGRPRFSVDELAERADVSRRTVFNHFDSLDDVVLTVASETLEEVLATLDVAGAETPTVVGTRAEFFDEIAELLRRTDLPHAVATLYWTLCGTDGQVPGEDPRQLELVDRAFGRAAENVAGEVARRQPGMDRLDIDLLVMALVHGVGVIAHHWITTQDTLGSPGALASWDRLVDRLLHSVRTGFLPEQ
ncbi:MAG TPA: TetR/AcrR family transcriptional regulator [Cellulomonas sp.]